ncbi:FKBP-type peptidyl-prolyl cis-trans isomerase [Spirosoma validum]|uniref:Peptidyl-prolyl cis-trans isomerase n=1 Tax=Spirosoma validum TaxID=2771355 RepID=A0A927AXK8_9BACT|nr:FKBP-type peptidyl-prolyl cis-trans isomerase [Spirosoma validum]MBD2751699.1 FKBP-type peptidyl-prolyl cis-trans isomerase [Spirosoma validum]
MYKLSFLILFAALIGCLSSCSTSVDPESTTAAATLDSNKTDIMTYATSEGLSGTMTTSGLYYVFNKPTSSTVVPAYGQELEFNYTLYVLNGPSNTTVTTGVTDRKIDSAYATTSIFYPFFAGSLKSGLQEGFQLMHEGDQVTLLIPSALAFGNAISPDGNVPANSPVRYDITLKRTRTEDQQITEYIAQNNLTVTQTTSTGLRFIKTASVTDTTTNKLPTTNQTITLRYTGLLLRSTTPFENTGTGTVSFTVGRFPAAGVNEGLAKLRRGEKATLIFPSSQGYTTVGTLATNGTYIVPPNAPLRYDVEIVSIQ